MLTAETLKAIRRIEIRTRRLVDTLFAGAYHSVFKGRGVVFDTVRPYEPGDDVRDIDWNVTARMSDNLLGASELYVKRYVEERELTVMLVMDASASIMFGTVKRQKRELAAELGAVLAFSAITNNDKVGLLLYSDRLEQYIPPRKGRKHVLRLIRDLLAEPTAHPGTNLGEAVRTVNRLLVHRAIVFLISDFLADPETYARDLNVLGRKHDLIAIVTSDPLEADFPDVGLMGLQDAETGEVRYVDTSERHWRRDFRRQAQAAQEARDAAIQRAVADRINLPVDGDYVQALTGFFRSRSRRLK